MVCNIKYETYNVYVISYHNHINLINLVLCNLSSSRLGYLGNLSSCMVGRKIWWEFCSSQNQLLCLKIPLVHCYLSKRDVEGWSLIPNSQHCLLSMMWSLGCQIWSCCQKYTGDSVIMCQFTCWAGNKYCLSNQFHKKEKTSFKELCSEEAFWNAICSANESKQSGTNTSKWIFQINKKEIN